MSVNDINSLSHTKWNCKYHLVFAPKYRRLFWRRGYYVDTVGKNTARIAEYIQNQLKVDKLGRQLTLDNSGIFSKK
ncbi:MAG: hypothetical protein K6G36_01485 [Candidatus Saccharibacteria bacterium]|nr:hypothetical protein [Candidatus Saccharibacteria bacterium]